MKKFLLVFIAGLFVTMGWMSCNSGSKGAQGENSNSATTTYDKNAVPVMTFEENLHDFGKLTEGEKVTYAFRFKNTGKAPLVISNASTSCGCTITAYPKQPIKPGEGATIDVSFNSEGKQGFQVKTITVYTNGQPPTSQVKISALVGEPEEH